MTSSVTLLVVIAVVASAGTYLLLERSLVRVLLGVVLLSNAVNVVLLVASGGAGDPPIVGASAPGEMSDPLPQALILTAIVITLGVTAFLLAMAYRSWQLTGDDQVQDDLEDRRIAAELTGDGEELDG
jgi:multicomponent Na+:H+ antiporter subunit C